MLRRSNAMLARNGANPELGLDTIRVRKCKCPQTITMSGRA